jgi:hypothetical protein
MMIRIRKRLKRMITSKSRKLKGKALVNVSQSRLCVAELVRVPA